MTAAERLRDMARVLGDTEWGASLADELRGIADAAEREARRGENPNGKLRRKRMQAHVMEVQRICAERKRRIKELNVRLAEVRAEAARYARMLGICADGTPVRRLDEVWTVDGDGPYHVDCNWADGTASLVEVAGHVECRTLTHERPGSAPAEPPEAVPVDAGGAPIRVGDAVRSTTGVELTVTAVEEASARPGDWVVTGRTGHGTTSFFASSLTRKRPAPRVIDQDGVECKVGDTVWVVDEAWPAMTVEEIDMGDGDLGPTDYVVWCGEWAEPGIKKWRASDELTHRAPVLAADGRPLSEGETPYRVDNGKQVEIRRIDTSYGESCVFVGVDGMSYGYWLRPDQLTHERPDSWERLEEDAGKSPAQYCRDRDVTGGGTTLYGGLDAAMRRDLVRRAKALAERDR